MKMYEKVLKKEIEERGISVLEVAKQTSIKKGRLQSLLNGDKKATLEELSAICAYLSLDVNKVLGIKGVDNSYMLLEDEVQVKLQEITKNIRKEYQKDFVRAVEYLAECFTYEEKENK